MDLKTLLIRKINRDIQIGIFCCGKDYRHDRPTELTAETNKLLENPLLQGGNWKYLGDGVNTYVFGNETVVFKMDKGEEGCGFDRSFGYTAPESLAAKVYERGHCNGLEYHICERLNTQELPEIGEVLTYLFKAREMGLVYWDGQPSNFGYDATGTMKVLDHEHFTTLHDKENPFEDAIAGAFRRTKSKFDYPFSYSDDKNTFVALNPNTPPEDLQKQQKQLLASLNVVGVKADDIEIFHKPPVFVIPQARVEYGTPPVSRKVSTYLYSAMREKIAVPGENGEQKHWSKSK